MNFNEIKISEESNGNQQDSQNADNYENTADYGDANDNELNQTSVVHRIKL